MELPYKTFITNLLSKEKKEILNIKLNNINNNDMCGYFKMWFLRNSIVISLSI